MTLARPYPHFLAHPDLGFTTLRNRVLMGRCTPGWKTAATSGAKRAIDQAMRLGQAL